MSKSTEKFFNSIEHNDIVNNIKNIYTSDGSINTLLDFERCLDEANLYAFRNWELGELVEGPVIKRYTVSCTFMYPKKLMPNPKGAIRLLELGCNVQFKKTTIKVPVVIKTPDDYRPGTHYPKLTEKHVWLIRIEMPKDLMDEIRDGSVDLAGQTVDLSDLDDAYEQDLNKEELENDDSKKDNQQEMPGQMPGAEPFPSPAAGPNPMGGMM
jgi:hypothetical protein